MAKKETKKTKSKKVIDAEIVSENGVDKTPMAKKKRVRKPKATLRERNDKAAENKDKTKRSSKVKSGVVKSGSVVGTALTTELHVIEPKEDPGFFMKSRTITPRYFREAWQELRLVVWPSRKNTWKLVFAVFVFSIILGGFITIMDYAFEKLFRAIIL